MPYIFFYKTTLQKILVFFFALFVTYASAAPQLINISTRAITSSGVGNVMAGFIIEGSGKCDLVIRAFGKSIGLSPQLNVHLRLQTHPAGTFIAENARITSYNVCYTKLLRKMAIFSSAA